MLVSSSTWYFFLLLIIQILSYMYCIFRERVLYVLVACSPNNYVIPFGSQQKTIGIHRFCKNLILSNFLKTDQIEFEKSIDIAYISLQQNETFLIKRVCRLDKIDTCLFFNNWKFYFSKNLTTRDIPYLFCDQQSNPLSLHFTQKR